MRKWNEQWRRLRMLLRRDQLDSDLAEEMRLHLELRAAEDPAAARSARIRFGNATRIKEESREAWSWPKLELLLQDVRYGLRTLAADRAFTIAALVSLALGIGANTAIFSLINALMLRTLPVANPNQLVNVQNGGFTGFTNPLWEEFRSRQTAFSGVIAVGRDNFDLNPGGEVHLVHGNFVNGDYFNVLGVPALRGRVFSNDDDRHGGGPNGPVAVISYAFWKSNFNGDPDIIGKPIHLDRVRFEIVGVTPEWFKGVRNDSAFDVAVPINNEPLFHPDQSALANRSWWWLDVIGRLRDGESIAAAETRLKAAQPEIVQATLPSNWSADSRKSYLARQFTLQPIGTGVSSTRGEYREGLFMLMALVAAVLLIACANVANLQFARTTARQRELTVRLALGAGRGRLIRQLLTENLLISALGGAAGLLLASWASRLLVHFLSTRDFEVQIDTSIDIRVALFIAAIVIVTTLLSGLAPAWRGSRSAADDGLLKEAPRGTIGHKTGTKLAQALVVVQVALSLLLLTSSVLFGESFRRILSIDKGFDPHGIELVNVVMPQAKLPKDRRVALFDQILDRLRQLPGVDSASRSGITPISGSAWTMDFEPDGAPSVKDGQIYCNRVSPAYLRTMGTPILAGRDFSAADTKASPRVMIVSEATARLYFGSQNPLGRSLRGDTETPNHKISYEIIGVVKDSKYSSLRDSGATAYFPASQDPSPQPETSFQLRLNRPPAQVLPAVRAAIAEIDKNLSIEIHSLDQQIADSLIQPRLIAILSTFFGLAALTLAATGLYGIIAYSVARRRSEIGLRMALGAQYGSVLWLVLREVAVMLTLGGIAGLAASLFASRFIGSLVFGVKLSDPMILTVALAVLALAATAAGFIPARKAARMDPMDALRAD